MLVDSHCHLPLIEDNERSVADLVADAGREGVSHMLCVCVDLPTYPAMLDAVRPLPNVFASVGIHPNTEDEGYGPPAEELARLADDTAVVAVGETGLDYYRDTDPATRAAQRIRFERHIEAARSVSKPLIVHTRESAQDVIATLRDSGASEVGGVMHCFVDDWETASAAMELGFYISISGIVTFKSAEQVRAVAARVPRDRLLVETDAPWLAPVPRRGRQNEPAYVRHTAEFLAELRGDSLATLAEYTSENFFRLFKHAA